MSANDTIEYNRLTTNVAMIGANGRTRAKSWPNDGRAPHAEQEGEWCRSQRPLCEYIDSEPTNEGPDEASFESDRDRDDHSEHEHQMRLSIPDPEVRGHGQFEEGRHRRSDRGEQQGH